MIVESKPYFAFSAVVGILECEHVCEDSMTKFSSFKEIHQSYLKTKHTLGNLKWKSGYRKKA